MSVKTIRNALLVASLSAALAACGGGGSNSSDQNDNPDTTPRPVEPINPPDTTPPDGNDQPAPDDGPSQPPTDPVPGGSEPEPGNGNDQPPPNEDEELETEPKPEPEPEPEVDRSAHLLWEAPTTKVDKQCLTDLVAYRISYGISPGVYTENETVEVKDLTCTDSGTRNDCGQINTCSYTVQELGTASWYFAVQAIDSNGTLSDYSNEEIKTIE